MKKLIVAGFLWFSVLGFAGPVDMLICGLVHLTNKGDVVTVNGGPPEPSRNAPGLTLSEFLDRNPEYRVPTDREPVSQGAWENNVGGDGRGMIFGDGRY